MSYLFTSESVSEGHPDKVADQISDALVDHFLAFDPSSRVACETLVTTGQVVLAGEVKSTAYLDVQQIARDVIKKIGYTKSEYMFEANSCGVLSAIHEQSPDISQGVIRKKKEDQGAGDQGMMFGYATNETTNYMPLSLDLAHSILRKISKIRNEGKKMKYLRPDAKSQVTVEYDNNNQPVKIKTIVVSVQHDVFADDDTVLETIREDIKNIVMPMVIKELPSATKKLFTDDIQYLINPTGKFEIGGPHGDAGVTGRKIIVDTYGGKGAHGGGAFSGKDPSKVDRSGAYATRHIAKNMVAAGLCKEVLVQVSYAIGIAQPTNLYVNTYGTAQVDMTDGEIARKIDKIFDMRPYAIEKRLKLRTPIYSDTASYGHMGRTPETKAVTFRDGSGNVKNMTVETFTWEKLDYVDAIRKSFKLDNK